MKPIVVIGAGGHARETKFLVEEINKVKPEYKFLGYIVSDLNKLTDLDSKKEVIGDLSWFRKRKETINVAIGIGTPKYRLQVAQEIREKYPNVVFPVLIHPNLIYDSKSCAFKDGVIIYASNVFTVNIRIKEFACLNRCCTVGHEAIIGAGSVLNPTVTISGGVNVGDGVIIGTGAQILQYVKVGDGAIVGSGACVTKDVEPGITVVGIPAKPLVKQHKQ